MLAFVFLPELSLRSYPSFRERLTSRLFEWVPDFSRFLRYYFSKYDPEDPVYSDPEVIWNTYLYNILTNLMVPNQKRAIKGWRRREREILSGGKDPTDLYYFEEYKPPTPVMPFFFIPLDRGRSIFDFFNIPREV